MWQRIIDAIPQRWVGNFVYVCVCVPLSLPFLSQGHATSGNMADWKQLPMALQNDEPYDEGGVFSGSATIIDDIAHTPVLT
jgi:hypothetical protein